VPRFEAATAERTADISSAYNYDVHVLPSFVDPGSDLRSAVSARRSKLRIGARKWFISKLMPKRYSWK
jgi:hypothetical protein